MPFRRLKRSVANSLLDRAAVLSDCSSPPAAESFSSLVAEAASLLDSESPLLRPRDSNGLPGGLLDLPELPVILLPDLHARPDFLAAALRWRPPYMPKASCDPGSLAFGPSLAELLEREEAILVCLGDAFHSEGPGAAEQWGLAMREYLTDWAETEAMDREMGRALACIDLILSLKIAFPGSFHYLKGNHDNIANEEGHGDHPFYKFALEGEMASSWFSRRYGEELLASYRKLELSLPLAVRGGNFVASHAEPAFALGLRDIVEYRRKPEVAEALTWTPNDGAEEGSVAASLEALLGPRARRARWYGGHRPVEGLYQLRAKGLYVQFHNPLCQPLAYLKPGLPPDPDLVLRNL